MEIVRTNEAAIKLIQRLTEECDICILVTTGPDGERRQRPMAAIKIDGLGDCWFFASRSSGKLKDLGLNNRLQVVFAGSTSNDFLEVHGRATIVCDEKEITDKWSPLVNEWFRDGVKDAELCLVKIETTDVFLRDRITGKINRLLIRTKTMIEAETLAA